METSVIYCGDNLGVLPKYIPTESVDLVYIDPPFNSNRNYEVFWGEAQERRSFEDRFGDAMTYLDWMKPRIKELYRVLAKTGVLYYHCDWHASHYVKVFLDQVFGADRFQNEIVWKRTNARSTQGAWPRVHDVLLVYSKSEKFIFNPLRVAADERKLPHTLITGPDGLKYQTYELTGPGETRKGESGKPWRGFNPAAMGRHWANTFATMDGWDAQGLIHWPRNTGFPRRRAAAPFDESARKVVLGDVWNDIDRLNQTAKERVGYPTQKPLALLERIIKASSAEGAVVLDAFCGCGTTLEAAAKLKRKWIGIDLSPTACRVMSKRLETRLGMLDERDFHIRDLPKSEDELRRMPDGEFQNWACIALGGIPNKIKSRDFGIDGRVYLADMERRGGKRPKGAQSDFLAEIDRWYPIQVKQQDRVGRPEIDKFETALRREKRKRGYFIAFSFSRDADKEMKRAANDGLEITPITVRQLLEFESQVA